MPWVDGDNLSPVNLNRKQFTVFNAIDPTYSIDSTGATDSTTSIRQLFSDASNGGLVYFPNGTYRFDSTLTRWANIAIRGDGKNLSVLSYGGSGNALEDGDTGVKQGQSLCDVQIFGSSASAGLVTKNWQRSYVQGVRFETPLGVGWHREGHASNGQYWTPAYSCSFFSCGIGVQHSKDTDSDAPANSNNYFGCDWHSCTTGVQINTDGGDDTSFIGCQFEGNRVALYSNDVFTKTIACRFESNTSDLVFGTNADYYYHFANTFANRTPTLTDSTSGNSSFRVARFQKETSYSATTISAAAGSWASLTSTLSISNDIPSGGNMAIDIAFMGRVEASSADTSVQIRLLRDGNVLATTDYAFPVADISSSVNLIWAESGLTVGVKGYAMEWRRLGTSTISIADRAFVVKALHTNETV